jgi:hypothetical protein
MFSVKDLVLEEGEQMVVPEVIYSVRASVIPCDNDGGLSEMSFLIDFWRLKQEIDSVCFTFMSCSRL